jgi:hypothetical protein
MGASEIEGPLLKMPNVSKGSRVTFRALEKLTLAEWRLLKAKRLM